MKQIYMHGTPLMLHGMQRAGCRRIHLCREARKKRERTTHPRRLDFLGAETGAARETTHTIRADAHEMRVEILAPGRAGCHHPCSIRRCSPKDGGDPRPLCTPGAPALDLQSAQQGHIHLEAPKSGRFPGEQHRWERWTGERERPDETTPLWYISLCPASIMAPASPIPRMP